MAHTSHQSIPTLLWARSVGQQCPRAVWNRLHVQDNMTLKDNFQIVSPHRQGISTLHMDRTEGRFLLAGSADATVSIYDLTPWGREPSYDRLHLGRYRGPMSIHKPVAQSLRRTSNSRAGHSASIVKAQWYAFDTGAFLSASSDGVLLVWDTQCMQPVAQLQPFTMISSFHLSKSMGPSESLVAVASASDASIKLVDLRSGSTSHTLTGHVRGVTTVQWCPTCDVVLASGSVDGTVRLWDIRKAGSRATIAVLDREEWSPLPLQPYFSDYRHLTKKTKRQRGPNTHDDSTGVASHGGHVTGVSFTSDGQFLVSCGGRQLQLWDLRSRGHLMTRHFTGSAKPPLLVVNRNIWMPYLKSEIGAYSLDQGGPPNQILEGHLAKVTALEYSFERMQLISGGADSMILAWSSQRRQASPSIVQASQPVTKRQKYGDKF